MKKLTVEQLKETVDAYQAHGNKAAAAEALGLSRSTFFSRLKAAAERGIPITAKEGVVQESGKGEDDKELTVNVRIKSLDAALEAAEVDLDVWEVDHYLINKWEMGYKDANEQARDHELWQVKIWLKRKVRSYIEDAIDRLAERVGTWQPVALKDYPVITQRHLLEIALFDHHFGKLAWGMETGNDYDLKTSVNLYSNAIEDLLERVIGYHVEQILLPIGQDFFHVNSWKNTTVNDTPQDVDTRMSKIFEAGCDAVINGIARCLAVAPVNVLWVPGNHDYESSWYMAKFIEAWYRNMDSVRVDKDPRSRKYVGYGRNLIGFTHGSEEAHRDLPSIMLRERTELAVEAISLNWHVGHAHKKKETIFHASDTYNGVRVQVIPSLCGTDAWHYKKGYVKGNRAAEAWLWSYSDGYVGHFNANMRLS
jgi:hypothetical protein